jgi:hypothetical protein
VISTFLGQLGTVATSGLALAAYAIVVAAWALQIWLARQPERRAREILSLYKSDRERNEALASLLGQAPPDGLKGAQLLEWTRQNTRYRSRTLLVVAYLSTLCAVIVIVALALFEAPTPQIGMDTVIERPSPPSR